MQVTFTERLAGPERLICEAELVFDDGGPLADLRLVGFSLWRGAGDEIHVTFPTRAFGVGSERRYFNYLRGDDRALARFKRFVVDAFRAREEAPRVGRHRKQTAKRSAAVASRPPAPSA